MKNVSPTIKGRLVLLRKPKESDIIDYLNVETAPELIRMYGGNSKKISPKTLENAQNFIQSMKDNKLEWAVEFGGRMIGQARLTVSEIDNRGRYAIGLFDPTVWGRGLGTEITQLILHYAFEELNLHRVDLRVLEYNKRAIKCYKKCGFIQEGVEREGALIEGKYETDVFMSILDREFNELKETFVQMELLI